MNPITSVVLQLQELTLLTWRVIRGFFKAPRYWGEMIRQMDLLGFGSLAINEIGHELGNGDKNGGSPIKF